MPTRTDWTAPHWEAVAAEQPPIDCTLERGAALFSLSGRPMVAEADQAPRNRAAGDSDRDVAAFGPSHVLRLLFAGEWHIIPSHSDLMGWTLTVWPKRRRPERRT